MVTQHFPRNLFFLAGIILLALSLAACQKNSPPTPPVPVQNPSKEIVTLDTAPIIRTDAVKINFAVANEAAAKQHIAFAPRGLTIAAAQPEAEFLAVPLPISVASANPFLAIAAKWSARATSTAKIVVSLRVSSDQTQWSEWQVSSLDGDPRTHTGLFFFPAASQFMQCKIALARDEKNQAPTIEEINFRFISPGSTPITERTAMLQTVRAERATIISRSNWHCPQANKNARQRPQTGKISHLIVHHTATSNAATDWPAVVRCIWDFHVFTNGWSDTGYHFLIDPEGVVYEGRAGGEYVAGSHFSCANSGTVGIAMLGNFMAQPPPATALESLKTLLADECERLKINPLSSTLHHSTRLQLPTISGHREANNSTVATVCAGTHCPGDAFYPRLPALRNEVQQLLISRTH